MIKLLEWRPQPDGSVRTTWRTGIAKRRHVIIAPGAQHDLAAAHIKAHLETQLGRL